jgi:hypothetical protein
MGFLRYDVDEVPPSSNVAVFCVSLAVIRVCVGGGVVRVGLDLAYGAGWERDDGHGRAGSGYAKLCHMEHGHAEGPNPVAGQTE